MNIEDDEVDESVRRVAKINNEAADALVQLGLGEYIVDSGIGLEKEPDIVLGYIRIGGLPEDRQVDENAVFLLINTPKEWRVIREMPEFQRDLGCFESAYGAIGLVRRYHPATDLLSGETPTYPEYLIEEICPLLPTFLNGENLMQYIVDFDIDDQEVVLSKTNRRTEVHLRKTDEREWAVWLDEVETIKLLGRGKSLGPAVEKIVTIFAD